MAEKCWTESRDRGVNNSSTVLTLNYQTKILKNGSNPICRLCEHKTKSTDHLMSGCPILTTIEYKGRHEKSSPSCCAVSTDFPDSPIPFVSIVAHELVLTSPAVSCMSCSYDLNDFSDGGRWPYSCCFVQCCFQDLFNMACSIFSQVPPSSSSMRLVSVLVVHLCSRMDTNTAWKIVLFYRIGLTSI